ncbi:hypothetical protein Echvi_3358 [Echinicola vietnamensis DSM 17526]|uniref:Uncharacterized protein n=1 Tax=Echinicola vietnamensis (strain DSM 17526 / LMG 23754 / KMM 6221) TaxID=926556 RepID=L0G086_ECHVK|nr:hypothetical protein Echvi_3358 [Echinicola vietnamensis DSM 17526]
MEFVLFFMFKVNDFKLLILKQLSLSFAKSSDQMASYL